MEKLLTTKDLARAIGASESSLRRWTDSGAIRTARTSGGHRRIPLSEAIRYIRQTGAAVVDPAALGLPEAPPAAAGASEQSHLAQEQFHQALVQGDMASARGQIIALYLAGMSVAAIADGPIKLALERIGSGWKHDPANILIEHRATDICLQTISLLRQLLPPPADDAPLAIGGAPAGDPYIIPSASAAAVFAEAGWRETNFGPNTPVELLASAAQKRGAAMVWLSVSTEPTPAVQKEFKRLGATLLKLQIPLAIGGRLAATLTPLRGADVHVLHTMAELSALARGARRKAAS
jgi:excisionase family DNA binding protein